MCYTKLARLVQDPALGTETPMPAYIATLQGQPTAIALEAIAPDGYNGAIKIIVAVKCKMAQLLALAFYLIKKRRD